MASEQKNVDKILKPLDNFVRPFKPLVQNFFPEEEKSETLDKVSPILKFEEEIRKREEETKKYLDAKREVLEQEEKLKKSQKKVLEDPSKENVLEIKQSERIMKLRNGKIIRMKVKWGKHKPTQQKAENISKSLVHNVEVQSDEPYKKISHLSSDEENLLDELKLTRQEEIHPNYAYQPLATSSEDSYEPALSADESLKQPLLQSHEEEESEEFRNLRPLFDEISTEDESLTQPKL